MKAAWITIKATMPIQVNFMLFWSQILVVSYFTFWVSKRYPQMRYTTLAEYLIIFASVSFFIFFMFRGAGSEIVRLIQWIRKERTLKNEAK